MGACCSSPDGGEAGGVGAMRKRRSVSSLWSRASAGPPDPGVFHGPVRDLDLARRGASVMVDDLLVDDPAVRAHYEEEEEEEDGRRDGRRRVAEGGGVRVEDVDVDDDDDDDDDDDERFSVVAVIGAGVAGAYAAQSIRRKYGDSVSVAIFEADEHVGGRLLSEAPPPPPASAGSHSTTGGSRRSTFGGGEGGEGGGDDSASSLAGVAAAAGGGGAAGGDGGVDPALGGFGGAGDPPQVMTEYGGMRVFPHAMPRTARLVRACGLHLVPVSTEDAENLFEFNGDVARKTDFKVAGRTVRRLVGEAVATFYRAHPEEEKIDPFRSERLRDMDFSKFFEIYGHLTEAQLHAIGAYSGYDLYDSRVSVATFLRLWTLYGSDRADQQFVAEGYQELVTRLLRAAQHPVYVRHRVREVRRLDDGLLQLHFEGGAAPWTARHVVLTGTKSELASVRKPPGDHRRWEAINDAAALPLFKAFLPFPRAWWRDLGLRHGKSTTDRKIRQVHYYGRSMLLVYCSGKPAAFWKGEFEKDPLTAARELLDQVREFHRVTPEQTGAPLRVDYHYWSDGSHKWLRDCDVHEARRLVAGLPPPDPEDEENGGGGAGAGAGASPPGDAAAPAQGDAKKRKAGKKKAKKGQGKAAKTKKARGAVAGGAAAPRELLRGVELLHEHSGNLWVAGDAYSLYQGWVEGALEMVDAIMDEL